MVDFGAPPNKIAVKNDIASAEGASEKNLTNFDLRAPANMHETPQKVSRFAPQLRKPKYTEKGSVPVLLKNRGFPRPRPKKNGGENLRFPPPFHQQSRGRKKAVPVTEHAMVSTTRSIFRLLGEVLNSYRYLHSPRTLALYKGVVSFVFHRRSFWFGPSKNHFFPPRNWVANPLKHSTFFLTGAMALQRSHKASC